MALTVTPVADPVQDTTKLSLGSHFGVIADVTFDSSYPTGGEAVGSTELAALGLTHINAVLQLTHDARFIEYDDANDKLLVLTAVGTEAADTSDQSGITVRLLFIGK